ncbi:MAG: DNA polymerase III subunit alpha [Chloroflexota bacterium]
MFVHLHAHSTYSFLESLASPAELAQAAARFEMPALALTDHLGLTGAIEFYDACQEAGVKPILGLELDVTLPTGLSSLEPRGGRLALLAADLSGWRSLCRLSSAMLAESPGPEAPLPFERLVQESQGLICLSGGRNGWIAHLLHDRHQAAARACLEHLHSAFPGRLYLELNLHTPQDRTSVDTLATLAEALHLALVAAHSLYYLTPEQAALQRTLAAMRLNIPLQTLPESASAPPAAYFTAPAEMTARFAAFPAALAATLEISERCQLELPLGKPRFPAIDLSPQQTPIQVLRHRAQSGALRLYGEMTPAIQSRLDHELAVIDDLGYASLFLIVEEILEFAYQRGVPISSRGSAASSLVAHCLGITSPDPLRLNLYFERFLNPARATPPDIDTDLCSRRRDQVIDFVYRRYGHERVAMVCTISRLRSRSALREVAKAHGLPPSEVSRLAESLPHRWYGPPERHAAPAEPFAELSERYPDPAYQAVFRDAAALLGLPRHLSIHPGGIVIAPGPLTDLAPTQMAAKGVVITQFDLESVERLGLVKIDLLGIRGLSVLGDVAGFIHNQQPGTYPAPLKALEAIPEDDPPTAELVRSGSTIGCFQIESPGMRATLKEIQASSVDDIMVALALYRPGPLTGGLKDAFVRRHRGQEPAAHLHPALAPLLEDTYGVILYQEQVLRIAHELAGFSLAEADLLRRAMSHFDPGEQMKTLVSAPNRWDSHVFTGMAKGNT